MKKLITLALALACLLSFAAPSEAARRGRVRNQNNIAINVGGVVPVAPAFIRPAPVIIRPTPVVPVGGALIIR